MYGIPSNVNYPPMPPQPPPPPPPQQQQQQPQQPQGGSYAARSAQAYSTAGANSQTNVLAHPSDPQNNINNIHNSSMSGNNTVSAAGAPSWNPMPATFSSPDYPYTMTPSYPTPHSMPMPQQPPQMPSQPYPYPSQVQPQVQPQPQFQPYPATSASDSQAILLQQSIRRMQEAMHIMRGAMEANDLSTTLDRANAMLGELGDPKHYHHHSHGHGHGHSHASHIQPGYGAYPPFNSPTVGHGHGPTHEPSAVMSPKHYYELHMMALDELPNLEEYFLSVTSPSSPLGCSIPRGKFTMEEIYQMVQFSPRAVPRLYLMICAGSALIRSGERSVQWVLKDLKEGVKCVQCPIRGLFLRHYLLQAMKDQLPDEKEESEVLLLDTEVTNQEHQQQQQEDKEKEEEEVEHGHVHTTAAMEHLMGDLLVGKEDSSSWVDSWKDPSQEQLQPQPLLQPGVVNHDSVSAAGDGGTKVVNTQHWMEDLGVNLSAPGTSKGFLDEVQEEIDLLDENLPVISPMGGVPLGGAPMGGVPMGGAPMGGSPPPVPEPMAVHAEGTGPSSVMEQKETKSMAVKDSYEFVLSNFIEMNKLWVRIQHMPGDSKTKEMRRQRERERNELRMMVGTNLVRLSELEGVTSAIYGTVILPKILDQIVACHDPLAQAYLMDCIIQVFPDEFHIQTLEVILSVCPKLREKVNIRTILQSIMNRLANYYADELLLNDEEDTEGVKMSVMMDSFSMFDECIKSVLDARGVKLTAREAVRLESALMEFTLKCYPSKLDYMDRCLEVCASALRGEGNHGIITASGVHVNAPLAPIPLDDRAIEELEKLLMLPLEELALGVLELRHYSQLLALLPMENRKKLAITLLKVLGTSGEKISSVGELHELFSIITPLMTSSEGNKSNEEQALIAKIYRVMFHEDTDVHFEILSHAKTKVVECGGMTENLTPIVHAALDLLNRVRDLEFPKPLEVSDNKETVISQQVPALDKEVAPSVQEDEVDKDEDKEVKESQQNEKEDDLSYEDEKEDDLSYGDIGEKTEDASKDKHHIDDLITQIDAVVKVEEDENEAAKAAHITDTSQATQQSPVVTNLEGDLFTDLASLDDSKGNEARPSVAIFTKQVNCRKIFVFIQGIVASLKISNPDRCLILSTEAAVAADLCSRVAAGRVGKGNLFTPIAYTFFSEAFSAYQRGLQDEQSHVNAIIKMVGSLLSCKALSANDYEALITKLTQFAARLTKKVEQCKMVMLCSHLFYSYDEGGYRNPQRALECLQRSLKIADVCVSSSPVNLHLFVDVLDMYLYHFENHNPVVTDKFITGLIALINEHICSIGANSAILDTKAHFLRIVKHVQNKKLDPHFSQIVCDLPI